jgi:outer membrane protein assembly factor BamE
MRILIPLLTAAALASAGCVYKLDVQQGNVVTQDSVSKLKKGMTKSEVRNVLGTPLLMDAFHGNRWDYYFSTETRGNLKDRTRFSVFFENDRLVSITGDIKAAAASTAPTVPAGAAAPAAPANAPAAPPKAPARPPATPTK